MFTVVLLALAACNPWEVHVSKFPDDTEELAEDDSSGSPELETWYLDLDADGYGDVENAVEAEAVPEGYVADATDCDDSRADVNPDEPETCDGTDNNCSGDESDASDIFTWYADTDADGYGDPSASTSACSAPTATIADNTDCDDTNSDVYPGATEICDDGVVNDCDGTAEDAYTRCGASGTSDLEDADVVFVGESADDWAGFVVASAGDVDGDGQLDLLFSAPLSDAAGTNSGAAYVVLGPVSSTMSLSDASARLMGEVEKDQAGSALASAGDVDGDGYSDLWVGAWYYGPDTSESGAAYMVAGPVTGDVSLADADAFYSGAGELTLAGAAVAQAGDLDGDGEDDALVGAYHYSIRRGATYLIPGPFGGENSLESEAVCFQGEADNDQLGFAFTGAGDLDGDGLDDLAVGAGGESTAARSAGAVYILLGPVDVASPDLADANAKLLGEAERESAGVAVAYTSDTDGDGYIELLVGAPSLDSAGLAYLISWPPTDDRLTYADATITGEAYGDVAGYAVADAGDVDGDGLPDLIIGAYGESTPGASSGAAYLLLSPVSGSVSLKSDAHAKFQGGYYEIAGFSVNSAGDVDSDGGADLLIGAPFQDDGGTNAGAAYLIHSGF